MRIWLFYRKCTIYILNIIIIIIVIKDILTCKKPVQSNTQHLSPNFLCKSAIGWYKVMQEYCFTAFKKRKTMSGVSLWSDLI